ncbi:MAG: hypothetical protein ACE5GE_13370 [Phycisphaerae bacterium]
MNDPVLSEPHLKQTEWLVWGSIGFGLAVSVTLGFLSEGGYHDDGLTHYLYAQWAWNDAGYLADAWGRPGLTVLLFPLARLGWWACRLESALLSAAAAWLAYDTAKRLGFRRAAWVPLLCWIQPLFLMASYTTLTETAAALYLILAVRCLVAGRSNVAAMVFSLCLITRYELWALTPIWALALWRSRTRWTAYALLLWAPLVHNLAGYLLLDRWPILFVIGANHPDFYGAGPWLSMALKSMVACGPAVAVCALAALAIRWPGVTGWVIPGLYAVHLMTQSGIFFFGGFSSGGYARFLVTAAPLAAICTVGVIESLVGARSVQHRALVGIIVAVVLMVVALEQEAAVAAETWIFLIDKAKPIVWSLAGAALLSTGWMWVRPGRSPALLLGLTAMVGSVVLLGYLVRPHRASVDAEAVRAAVRWLETSPHAKAPVITANIWTCYYLDRGQNLIPPDSADILANAQPGTVLVWDANHATHARFGLTHENMQQRTQWRQVWQSRQQLDGDCAAHIYVHR